MSEPKWTWYLRAACIQLIEPSGGIFLEFQCDDDVRDIAEEKVRWVVDAMNKHDRLVTALEATKQLCEHVMEGESWLPGKRNHPFVVNARKVKGMLEDIIAKKMEATT